MNCRLQSWNDLLIMHLFFEHSGETRLVGEFLHTMVDKAMLADDVP